VTQPTYEIPDSICRSAAHHVDAGELRATSGGSAFSLAADDEKRTELLAMARAGEVVELDISFVAYRQQRGQSNANYTRFAADILADVCASFEGLPLLRDHNTHNIDARAGTVIGARYKRIRGGGEFHLTGRVTAQWAVVAVLEGNLDRFSIAWVHGGRETIICSACDSAILTECYHWPGDLVERQKKTIRAEWIYTVARGREASGVSDPAVDGTGIEGIRASLNAANLPCATPTTEDDSMSLKAIAKSLGLSEDATADDIEAAIKAKQGQLDAAASEAAQLRTAKEAAEAAAAASADKARAAEIDQLFAKHVNKFPVARDGDGNKVRHPEDVQLRELAATQYDFVEGLLEAKSPYTPADGPPVHTPEPTGDPANPAALSYDSNPGLRKACKQLGVSADDFAQFNPVNGTAFDA